MDRQLPVILGMTFESDCIVNGELVKAGTHIPFAAPPAGGYPLDPAPFDCEAMVVAMRWIPVAERLPDDDTSVMIALREDADDVWIGWHDGEMGWVCDNGPLGERVTHWMPLPKGPK